VLGVGLSVPASVAHASILLPDEVVVTARRTEEAVQTVPISMTVFNQEMLTERNVTSVGDLAAFTPSLAVNNRFGADQATFAIRGFTQELRTTASVAVYFADVVAPRGGGNITSGDGAGPGSFFDLQNVQVLKGPQGTLFGRNTTGGAIQLVPQEPTDKLEGYLEQSFGNYDMRRTQGVINVPINDHVRARFGFDTEKRDGYLVNTADVGPDRFADVDYLAGRGSLMVDVTDSIQNYTIFSQTSSENNGSVQAMFACSNASSLGALCAQQLAQTHGFYNVADSDQPDPTSKLKQWQLINTTTWNVNDALTFKNNLSYADLDQTTRGPIFGTNFKISQLPYPITYATSGTFGSTPTNWQSSMVEELQASGSALDDKLTWQAGYYYEMSRPDGWAGSQNPGQLACSSGTLSTDPASWSCINPGYTPPGNTPQTAGGNVTRTLYKTEYNNQALYSQGTYDFTDEWRATLGLRYTVDHTESNSKSTVWYGGFATQDLMGPGPVTFPINVACIRSGLPANGGDCAARASTKSEAPTWLIDVDYLPTPDVMIYAKYARGYRQGSIVAAAPAELLTYDPEQVDSYELGAKTSFQGPIPGTFNIALFYNELQDQQLQLGLFPLDPAKGSASTAIVNAGSSTIQGLEVESTLKLLADLTFNLGYTYLDTHLDSADYPNINPNPLNPKWITAPAAIQGDHLTFSPRHTVVTGLSYRLPLPVEVGDVSAGANYTFTSAQQACSAVGTHSPYCELGARQLLNLNLGWKGIFGSAFDASFFMTNALNEQYLSYVSGTYAGTGFESGTQGEPKMWGGRVKYTFQ
jgi:iron complex outermembrane receptor protein